VLLVVGLLCRSEVARIATLVLAVVIVMVNLVIILFMSLGGVDGLRGHRITQLIVECAHTRAARGAKYAVSPAARRLCIAPDRQILLWRELAAVTDVRAWPSCASAG